MGLPAAQWPERYDLSDDTGSRYVEISQIPLIMALGKGEVSAVRMYQRGSGQRIQLLAYARQVRSVTGTVMGAVGVFIPTSVISAATPPSSPEQVPMVLQSVQLVAAVDLVEAVMATPVSGRLQARIAFRDAAVLVGDDVCEQLAEAARTHSIHVVIGCNEIDDVIASSTIYNTLLFFDRDGRQYGRHRKLMPTFTERMFWGAGDARDLQVFNTDIGRIGGLVCGEHLMPLTRASMISLGEDIHIAAFPGAFALHTGPLLESPQVNGFFGAILRYAIMRLRQERLWSQPVPMSTKTIVSNDFPFKESMNIAYATGGSSVISPLGVPLVEPTTGSRIVHADCPGWMIKATKAIVDAAGHYSRPDVASSPGAR